MKEWARVEGMPMIQRVFPYSEIVKGKLELFHSEDFVSGVFSRPLHHQGVTSTPRYHAYLHKVAGPPSQACCKRGDGGRGKSSSLFFQFSPMRGGGESWREREEDFSGGREAGGSVEEGERR